MPRSENLRAVSVYAPQFVIDALAKGAARDRRSLSNFLLHAGIARTEAFGILVYDEGRRGATAPKKRATRA